MKTLFVISFLLFGNLTYAQTNTQTDNFTIPTVTSALECANIDNRNLDLSNLVLFGRGIKNHKTKDSIAFICIGQNELRCTCEELLMHIHKTNENRIVSSSYFIAGKKEFKQMLKKKIREEKAEDDLSARRVVAPILLGVTAVVGFGVGGPVGAAIGVAALGYGGYYVINPTLNLSGNPSAMKAFNSQNGWNWSAHAKQVSQSQFKLIFDSFSFRSYSAD